MCSLVSRRLFNLWPIHFVAAYTGARLLTLFIDHFSLAPISHPQLVYVVGSEQAYF